MKSSKITSELRRRRRERCRGTAPEACVADDSAPAAADRDAATTPSRAGSWDEREGPDHDCGKVGSASRGVTVGAGVGGGSSTAPELRAGAEAENRGLTRAFRDRS